MDNFKCCATEIIDEFVGKQNSLIYPPLKIQTSFLAERGEYENDRKRAFNGPIFIDKSGDGFTLHLCKERLQELPLDILKGWLTHHAAMCIPKLQPEFYSCNFLDSILPIMPVTGLAAVHIIEVASLLERALHHYVVTESLINLGYGISQCHFYFNKVQIEPEDFESYKMFLPYGWSRSLFLCRILDNLMGIFVLAHQGVPLSNDLKSYWLDIHRYLLPVDLDLMKSICNIPGNQNGREFSDTVIEMFKKVKEILFEPKTNKTMASSVLVH